MLCHTVLHPKMSVCTVLCYTLLCFPMLCYALLCCATLCYNMVSCALFCFAELKLMLYNIIRNTYYTMYSTLPYTALLCSFAILHYSLLHHAICYIVLYTTVLCCMHHVELQSVPCYAMTCHALPHSPPRYTTSHQILNTIRHTSHNVN